MTVHKRYVANDDTMTLYRTFAMQNTLFVHYSLGIHEGWCLIIPAQLTMIGEHLFKCQG